NFIHGTVKDGGGVPVAGAGVNAYQGGTGATCCTWVGGATTDSNGNYSFVVPAGTYKIYVNPPSPFPAQWNGGTDFGNATPITVNGSTLVNITLSANFIQDPKSTRLNSSHPIIWDDAYRGNKQATCDP